MIKEYDLVKTLVTKNSFPIGSKGIVVSIYSDNKACEVEIWDSDNYPIDVITYLITELEKI